MYKKQSLSLAVAMCLSVGLGQSLAAEPFAQIKSLKGDAMVTQGERFITAREGMELQQLDRIAVLEQSGAMIEFSDGCEYQMKEMELLTIGSASVCKSRKVAEYPSQEVEVVDYQAVKQTAISQTPPPPPSFNTTPWLFGGVVAASLGLVVYDQTQNQNNESVPGFISPE